jgi:hypothetical protein
MKRKCCEMFDNTPISSLGLTVTGSSPCTSYLKHDTVEYDVSFYADRKKSKSYSTLHALTPASSPATSPHVPQNDNFKKLVDASSFMSQLLKAPFFSYVSTTTKGKDEDELL